LLLALAATFEALGIAGLFSTTADAAALRPLILQALWILAASILLLTRPPDPLRSDAASMAASDTGKRIADTARRTSSRTDHAE
jgi:hypothetical protein